MFSKSNFRVICDFVRSVSTVYLQGIPDHMHVINMKIRSNLNALSHLNYRFE